MTRKKEGIAGNNPTNTFDYLTGNQNCFSMPNYAESQDKLQSNLLAVIKPPKVIRLYHCFGCEKSFSPKKMSNCLAVCKACYASVTAQNKGKVARNNFIEKALNNFQKFLRRRVSV
jgi:hypothetical protein